MRRWVATSETYYKMASRTVCYLSAEFLLGPHLGNNLLSLGLHEEARRAMAELGHDLADFRSYLGSQADVERAYLDSERWTRMSILNTARMGRFSSDRSIADCCRDIWRVAPVPIEAAP